jgi:curved DNA-binding protein CbpA
MRGKAGRDQARVAEDKETAQRRARAVVPREFARPVEVILRVYEDEKTDLYDVLAVPRGATDVVIKKAYRTAALSVHPDKNPHPDAKAAFDALQDAFATLAAPLKRDAYDKELRRRRGRWSRAVLVKKLRKRVSDELYNLRSRWQLFWHRLTHGEAAAEYKELIRDPATTFARVVEHFIDHINLLPSAQDRLQLISERSWDARKTIFGAALALSLAMG